MPLINPFQPNSPVSPGMFAGRLAELDRLERALVQTQAGRPVNFLITGERGIGKSSLLLYVQAVAGGFSAEMPDLRFLVLDTDIDKTVTQLGLLKKIELSLRFQLGKSEKARSFLKQTWEFVQRVEAGGFGIKGPHEQLDESVFEEFCYSLADTVNRLCNRRDSGDTFGATYDGVILIIDEADKASTQLHLGSFLKLLSERLQRRGCDRFMFGLAGLPEVRATLKDSHESSLRLFDVVHLDRLKSSDVESALNQATALATEQNSRPIEFTSSGIRMMTSLSEGFPHFLQQFGYSAFEADTDSQIDMQDVIRGGFAPGSGALELIGNRYYRDDFYEKIKKDSYRQVLRIMANRLDRWITKDELRAQFKGRPGTLDNAIQALKTRRLIVPQEGARGIYRLQNKGFAWWIRIYTNPETIIHDHGDADEEVLKAVQLSDEPPEL